MSYSLGSESEDDCLRLVMLSCNVSLSCFRLFRKVLTLTDSMIPTISTVLAAVFPHQFYQFLRAVLQFILFMFLPFRSLFAMIALVFPLHFPLFTVETIEELLRMRSNLRCCSRSDHLLNHLPVLAVCKQSYVSHRLPCMNFSCSS